MQLLGATDLFIKVPYILKGIILGLSGSIFSFLLLYFMYRFSIYILDPYYQLPTFSMTNVIVLNLVIGPVLGLVGSIRALSTYVKK